MVEPVVKLKESFRAAFSGNSTESNHAGTLLRTVFWVSSCAILVLALEPDLYGLVPNVLDPIFYTAYTTNLDAVIAISGDDHYFVTRWPAYLPGYFLSEVIGGFWARLVLRAAMVAILAEVIWRFLETLKTTAKVRIFVIGVLITTPMFVRAFTTDYPEYFLIWAGLVSFALSFGSSRTILRTTAIGLLTSMMVIANPTALMFVVLIVANYEFQLSRGMPWLRTVWNFLLVLLLWVAVALFGLLYFRIRYDLSNVYAPTLDFISRYRPPEIDGWRAPDRGWLLYFGWLYLPVFYLVAATLFNRNVVGSDRTIVFRCAGASGLLFGFHVFLELRSGHALETSFYWSQLLAPVLLLLVVLLASSLKTVSMTNLLILGAAIVVFYRFEIPQRLQLPSGPMLVVFFLVSAAGLWVLYTWRPRLVPALLLAVTVWAQVGSPTYSITTHGGNLNSPRYDAIYGSQARQSNAVLEEVLWLTEQMDSWSLEQDAFFTATDDWSFVISGVYLTHLYGRFVPFDLDDDSFSSERLGALLSTPDPGLVIYGPPSNIVAPLKKARELFPEMSVVLDVTNTRGRGYRLIALSIK